MLNRLEDRVNAHPRDGYPLTDVELTRWNARQHGRDALCCPRHPAEALVGGDHEATGDPAWLCVVCGYITPVVEDDLATVLGATTVYTQRAATAAMRPDTRLLIPAHPARTAQGTLAIRPVPPVAIAAVVAVMAIGLLAWVSLAAAVSVGLIMGVAAWATSAAATRHMLAPTPRSAFLKQHRHDDDGILHRRVQAVDLAAGHWVAVTLRHGSPRLTSTLTRSTARVMQSVRCGGTDMLRITTTAGVITTSARSQALLVDVEALTPGMTDYTYLLPSNRTA